MSHKALPWMAQKCGDFGGWGIIATDPMRGRVDSQITGMSEEDAKFIVRAVNAFDPMRKAITNFVNAVESRGGNIPKTYEEAYINFCTLLGEINKGD